MKRRELLKALLPIPLTPVLLKGEEVGKAVKIDASAKYVVFINPARIDIDDFMSECRAFPAGTSVHCVYGEDIDEAVRIFKL